MSGDGDTNNICKNIKITINKETGETSIWNDGMCIPIEKKLKLIFIILN